ncbi:peptide-N4-(N-acetyl-beta-glucosaminyl)asparagine amidase A-like [Humulus lupulus]|uniref:peptide-N4-(N-acetyl-beta- glucosaminyl)asparagine amidase A-like n=1 Tax=Humulus lupulus TaxID=3486 RepID=UPI002B40B56B|nr:peptide-N4-(N-acetyl-beta-glucosaminyl)asparagine amidase A-like [Humulus lupulus]
MASSSPFSLLFLTLSLLLLLLHQPLLSTAANHHKLNSLRPPNLISELSTLSSDDTAPPTRYFQVTKPIKLPQTKPCSHVVLRHDFAYTYGRSPVLATYTPPSDCHSQPNFSKIVLQWSATCKGRQFDRIFGVWLGGVELLRSCTAEPRATGIVWSVEKDVTRYYSLLLKNQTLAVYLGNLIDTTYTGVYHVNVTFHFYPTEENFERNGGNLEPGYDSWADLVLPISRNLPLNNGLWFEIENSTDFAFKELKIPQNAYRAVLEVYVSFHENDEFWYSNLPDEYIEANNLTGTPGNGPFREVLVSLDGVVVGSIWPFTVIFTGGVNPLLWRPITAIGSFDLPSYNIEITPFLGEILDGKTHKIGFNVNNALNVWYIDANLHLWLDKQSEKTEGQLLKHVSFPLVVSLVSNFSGLDGTFLTSASRSIKSTGWVKSSYGNITTDSIQDFSYHNSMVMRNSANMQIVRQRIHFNDSVQADSQSSQVHSLESLKKFSLFLYSDTLDQGNKTYLSISNVSLGYNEKKSKGSAGLGFTNSSLKNHQSGQGNMLVKKNLVVSGLGSTQQVYKYNGADMCYFRNISSSNYTILYDNVGGKCSKTTQLHSHRGLGFHRLWPIHSRRVSLGSGLLDNSKA